MDVVHRCCCGLDVHKDTVTACVAWAEATGKKRHDKRQFGTTTRDLLALADLHSESLSMVVDERNHHFARRSINSPLRRLS